MSDRLNIKEEEQEKINLTNSNTSKSNIKLTTIEYISFAKIISSYGVIILHINGFWRFQSNSIKLFRILNFYETFFYYSVPVFVLCIGATLLNFPEKYSLTNYNKKRFIKVFIPLLGWNVILYLYKVYYLKKNEIEKLNFSNIWNYFFLSKIYHIFDSLHTFLLTYMLIPLLANIDKTKKMKIYIYYFFLLLISQSIIPYIIKVFQMKIVWIYTLKIGYLIYIFAGYIIHNYNFQIYQKIIIYVLGIFSFFLHYIGTEFCYYTNPKDIRLHKGYLNLPAILYACAVFLLLKEYSLIALSKINKNFIDKIGSLTFGPFFLHIPMIEIINRIPRLYNFFSFNTLFFGLLIFCLCLLITKALKCIPIFKYLVP